MTDFFFFRIKGITASGTPENLVCKPDIDTGNIFEAADVSLIENDLAGHALHGVRPVH